MALSMLAEVFDDVVVAIGLSHLPTCILTHVKDDVGERVLPRDRVLAG